MFLWMTLVLLRLTLVTVAQAINYPLIIATIFLVCLLTLGTLIMLRFVPENTHITTIIGWNTIGLCMMCLSVLILLWVVAILA